MNNGIVKQIKNIVTRVRSSVFLYSHAGFTLIELLIVVTIMLGLSITSILFGIQTINKAKVTQVLAQITETKRAYGLYRIDVNEIPVEYNTLNENPLIIDPGLPGWNGPYTDSSSLPPSHPWHGHFGWYGKGSTPEDRDGNGGTDFIILLDDDRPGTLQNDNTGVIPQDMMILIDRELDDGNLSTGRVQGDGADFGGLLPTEPGELAIWVF